MAVPDQLINEDSTSRRFVAQVNRVQIRLERHHRSDFPFLPIGLPRRRRRQDVSRRQADPNAPMKWPNNPTARDIPAANRSGLFEAPRHFSVPIHAISPKKVRRNYRSHSTPCFPPSPNHRSHWDWAGAGRAAAARRPRTAGGKAGKQTDRQNGKGNQPVAGSDGHAGYRLAKSPPASIIQMLTRRDKSV